MFSFPVGFRTQIFSMRSVLYLIPLGFLAACATPTDPITAPSPAQNVPVAGKPTRQEAIFDGNADAEADLFSMVTSDLDQGSVGAVLVEKPDTYRALVLHVRADGAYRITLKKPNGRRDTLEATGSDQFLLPSRDGRLEVSVEPMRNLTHISGSVAYKSLNTQTIAAK